MRLLRAGGGCAGAGAGGCHVALCPVVRFGLSLAGMCGEIGLWPDDSPGAGLCGVEGACTSLRRMCVACRCAELGRDCGGSGRLGVRVVRGRMMRPGAGDLCSRVWMAGSGGRVAVSGVAVWVSGE